jgi:hypothetical protein
MYGFHFTLRVLGVGWIQDTQCGFKVGSSLSRPNSLTHPRVALHAARRAGHLPASSPSQLDIRRRTPPHRLVPAYPGERSPGALARSRREQAQCRHCHLGHGVRFIGDAFELHGGAVERLGWVWTSGSSEWERGEDREEGRLVDGNLYLWHIRL